MLYIVVLNWNNAEDTINCVKSILKAKYEKFKVIVVDNNSKAESVEKLETALPTLCDAFISLSPDTLSANVDSSYPGKSIFLIKNNINSGYAGGNNVGVKFALHNSDLEYVWILNNDTEIHPDAIGNMIDKFTSDVQIGICGSRLVDFDNRELQQSLGGIHNKWLCTTKSYGHMESSSKIYNDNDVADKIDYIVGASMMFTKRCLKDVGLMSEEYFLYYEEIDICERAKQRGFKLGVCSSSIVYHKEGASTGGGKSNIADYCSVRNRLIVTRKFFKFHLITVWLSLFIVAFNRARRKEYNKMKTCLKIIFGKQQKIEDFL